MKKLGVERAQDKELYVRSETGKGHAAGCFLDGIMTATGCTYGKSNIEPEIIDPQVERIKGLPESEFLDIGEVHTVDFKPGKGIFEVKRCDNCGEAVFVNKLQLTPDGKVVCMGCSEYES